MELDPRSRFVDSHLHWWVTAFSAELAVEKYLKWYAVQSPEQSIFSGDVIAVVEKGGDKVRTFLVGGEGREIDPSEIVMRAEDAGWFD